MYKEEVERSLIKWPVIASTAMLAMFWFIGDEADLQDAPRSEQDRQQSSKRVADTETGAALVDLSLRGASGAKQSDEAHSFDRLAEHGQGEQDSRSNLTAGRKPAEEAAESNQLNNEVAVQTQPVIRAPVRLVEQELAGLDLAEIEEAFGNSAKGLEDQDFPLNSLIDASGKVEGLFSLREMGPIENGVQGLLSAPWSAGFWKPDSQLAQMVDRQDGSVLHAGKHASAAVDRSPSEAGNSISQLSWNSLSQAIRDGMIVVQKSCDDCVNGLVWQSERLKQFVAEHRIEKEVEAAAGRTTAEQVTNTAKTVVPVAGVVLPKDTSAPSPVKQSVSRKVSMPQEIVEAKVHGWPETKQLAVQLSDLSGLTSANEAFRFVSADGTESNIADWVTRVQMQLSNLRALPRLGDERAGNILEILRGLAAEGSMQAELVEDRPTQVQWLQTSYAIARRMAVWTPVWKLAQLENVRRVPFDVSETRVVESAVEQVREDLVPTGDVAGWNSFLMLDEILKQGQDSGDHKKRALLSQRLMSRLEWHSLGKLQSDWLRRPSIENLVAVIRPWSHTVIDYSELLKQLEQQESNSIDLAAVDIAGAAQTLRFAENPVALDVSDGINTHYRNANVRFAISDRFIERMIPAIEAKTMPVRTQVLGARVSGTSKIESQIDVDLKPSMDRWMLSLNARGKVNTESVGRQGAVSVRTAALAKFDAASLIEVTPRNVDLGDANARVRSSTRLRGVETAYDGWPLVGTLVRSIAEDRYREMAPQANRIADREARKRIESEIDEQLETRVDQAAVKVSEMVLGPLGRLQLDPRVTDMRTTEQRLMARYRVAGDWQLGAFTPRPRALSDSLMSVQLHQSALNNTLEQLMATHQAIGIRELMQKTAATFGKTDIAIPEDIPGDVSIQFARTRPITVEIEDGMLWLTLRIIRLRRDEGIDLTQFIVRAAYRPEVEGMNARLVRDGHLRISGPRMAMRERLPVRAIFNKVFATNREIPLTVSQLTENPATEGLIVSQLELRDGWLAMAISEAGAARIAQRQD